MEKNTLESALKEFSQTSGTNANDVKEFFALMSDGSIKRMPKEDMATVLGGLIDPLCNKGFVSVVNNSALTIWTTGIYGVSFVDTAVTPDMQYPSFTGEIYGTLIVSKGGDLLSQTLITNQGIWARGHTYRRFQETNVPWIKL